MSRSRDSISLAYPLIDSGSDCLNQFKRTDSLFPTDRPPVVAVHQIVALLGNLLQRFPSIPVARCLAELRPSNRAINVSKNLLHSPRPLKAPVAQPVVEALTERFLTPSLIRCQCNSERQIRVLLPNLPEPRPKPVRHTLIRHGIVAHNLHNQIAQVSIECTDGKHDDGTEQLPSGLGGVGTARRVLVEEIHKVACSPEVLQEHPPGVGPWLQQRDSHSSPVLPNRQASIAAYSELPSVSELRRAALCASAPGADHITSPREKQSQLNPLRVQLDGAGGL
jgi:hypothetical protein